MVSRENEQSNHGIRYIIKNILVFTLYDTIINIL